MLLWGKLEAALGRRAFSTLDRGSALPPTSKSRKEPESAGFGRAVQLVKGKDTRDFPNRVPRLPFWWRQLLGYARAGLPEILGRFRPGPNRVLGQQAWPSRGSNPVPQSPRLQTSSLRTAGVVTRSFSEDLPYPEDTPPPTILCCPLESGWWIGGGESGLRKEAGPKHN